MELKLNTAVNYTAAQFAVSAGVGDLDWEFNTNQSTVPEGLTLTRTQLTGTPTKAGTGSIALTRYDDYGAKLLEAVPVNVPGPTAPPPVVEPTPVPETPGKRIADFLGQGDNVDVVEMAGEHSLIITAMARAYTRGGGFVAGVPNEEVAAVITTATARLVANPEQIDYSVGGTRIGRGFQGWSLGETAVLNRYRKRSL